MLRVNSLAADLSVQASLFEPIPLGNTILSFSGYSKIDFNNTTIEGWNGPGNGATGGAIDQIQFEKTVGQTTVQAQIDMGLNDQAQYPYASHTYCDGPKFEQTRMLVRADPDVWAWTGPLGGARPHQSEDMGKNSAFEV